MKKFTFKKIDAFATALSAGNPAGTVWLNPEDGIDEREMLQIAKELRGYVSEVGYIRKTDEKTYSLKYYSAEREVNFCGHATIALMYELFQSDPAVSKKDRIAIITNNGKLEVENRIRDTDAVFITAPKPVNYKDVPSPEKIGADMGLNADEFASELPIRLIDAGLRTLLVPIVSLNAILGIRPEIDVLKNFCLENGIDIIEVFTPETRDRGNDYRVRVFSPTFGYLEDPATGSGNSALGYYLLDAGLWNKDTIRIEQGREMESFNIVQLQKRKDEGGKDRILFGGGAIKRIQGEYLLSV